MFDLKKLTQLCERYSTPPDDLLRELERYTHLHTVAPQMMAGPLQGAFLQLFSRLLQPRSILEIGTFTGYSAICLARGLAPQGRLITIEANPEFESIASMFFEKAGLHDRIELLHGDALQLLPGLNGPFDLAFIDANKRDNARLFELVVDKVRPGGFILVDNVLWSGKVGQTASDADTLAIEEFLRQLNADERVRCLLLPLRDGLLLAEKKTTPSNAQGGSTV